jgi:apolipoprotein N-acyltransferase
MKYSIPIGIRLVVVFFAFGATMCALTLFLLAFPGTRLDQLWNLNPAAKLSFQSLGGMSLVVMGVVGLSCASAAIGLARASRWGWWLALTILAVNLIADSLNGILRHDYRPLIGLPVGSGMIAYLLLRSSVFS